MQKEVEGNKRITQCMGCMEIYEAFDDICPYCGYINGTMPEEMYHLEDVYKRQILSLIQLNTVTTSQVLRL